METWIPSDWKIGLLTIFLMSILLGCSTLQPYVEPDPAKEPTARMRVIIAAGWRSRVSFQPNNDKENCLLGRDGVSVPSIIKNPESWSEVQSKQKIGMPLGDEGWNRYGAEFYIPTKDDLTVFSSISRQIDQTIVTCNRAFRFKPEAGKDYQLIVQANLPKYGFCIQDFKEIYQDKTSKKYGLRDAPMTPVFVKGSPGWKKVCDKSNGEESETPNVSQ